jgi:hypothetical protein
MLQMKKQLRGNVPGFVPAFPLLYSEIISEEKFFVAGSLNSPQPAM